MRIYELDGAGDLAPSEQCRLYDQALEKARTMTPRQLSTYLVNPDRETVKAEAAGKALNEILKELGADGLLHGGWVLKRSKGGIELE